MTPDGLTKNLGDRIKWSWCDQADIAEHMARDIVDLLWPAILADNAAAYDHGRADQRAADEDPTLRGARIRWLNPYCGQAELVGVERGVVQDDGE